MSKSSMIPFIANDNQFLVMRNTLLPKPTVKERETQHRIAAVSFDEEINNHNTKEKTTSTTTISKQNKPNKFTNTLFLHYTHEKRLHSLKRDIHKIYSEIFQDTIGIDFRLIVGHRNHRNTGHELIQRRPHSSLLKPTPLPSKIFLVYLKLSPIFNHTLFQIP
jgi:CRISPR/Cas system endoribonuclease Cas6 (RAMP superfamily)